MNFTKTPPTWEAAGTEPSSTLQTNGFTAGYKPPASYFNYLFHKYTDCISEIQTALADYNATEIAEMLADVTGLNTNVTSLLADVLGLKYDLEGFRSSKNLYDYASMSQDSNIGTYANGKLTFSLNSSSGYITISNTSGSQKQVQPVPQFFDAGTYTYSITSSSTVAGGVCYFMRGDTVANQKSIISGTQSFTVTTTVRQKLGIYLLIPNGATVTCALQIEKNDTATEFAPYNVTAARLLSDLYDCNFKLGANIVKFRYKDVEPYQFLSQIKVLVNISNDGIGGTNIVAEMTDDGPDYYEGTQVTAGSDSGKAVLLLPDYGAYSITATKGSLTATTTITADAAKLYTVNLTLA